MKQRPPFWDLLRDIIFVAVGVFILLYQTLTAAPQVELIGAALALLGLPLYLRLREKERNGE